METKQIHTQPIVSRENALFLAERMGAESLSDNRYVFNMISDKLFSSYLDLVYEPLDNRWRELPTQQELIDAAERGKNELLFQNPDASQYERFEDVCSHIKRRLKMFYNDLFPEFEHCTEWIDDKTRYQVITNLMEMREQMIQKVAKKTPPFLVKGLSNISRRGYFDKPPRNYVGIVYAQLAVKMVQDAIKMPLTSTKAEDMVKMAKNLELRARVFCKSDYTEGWNTIKESCVLINTWNDHVAEQSDIKVQMP